MQHCRTRAVRVQFADCQGPRPGLYFPRRREMKKVTLSLAVIFFAGLFVTSVVAQNANQSVDAEGHQWWQHAVFYELYPRSFADSNNDGIGDLNGINQHLDYLHWLGVDAVWISPMFPSPQVDFGYDVSDYENVDPKYGTLADMDSLIANGKSKNVKF